MLEDEVREDCVGWPWAWGEPEEGACPAGGCCRLREAICDLNFELLEVSKQILVDCSPLLQAEDSDRERL